MKYSGSKMKLRCKTKHPGHYKTPRLAGQGTVNSKTPKKPSGFRG